MTLFKLVLFGKVIFGLTIFGRDLYLTKLDNCEGLSIWVFNILFYFNIKIYKEIYGITRIEIFIEILDRGKTLFYVNQFKDVICFLKLFNKQILLIEKRGEK